MIYATEQQVVVTVVMVVTVALVALFTGILWGHRMSRKEAEEEERWAREQAQARRVHPVYQQLSERIGPAGAKMWATSMAPELISPEVAHEAWAAHEDQALTVANGPWLPPDETVLEPTAVLAPGEETTTAWTARMAADMDAFLKGLIGRTDEQLREITR